MLKRRAHNDQHSGEPKTDAGDSALREPFV